MQDCWSDVETMLLHQTGEDTTIGYDMNSCSSFHLSTSTAIPHVSGTTSNTTTQVLNQPGGEGSVIASVRKVCIFYNIL